MHVIAATGIAGLAVVSACVSSAQSTAHAAAAGDRCLDGAGIDRAAIRQFIVEESRRQDESGKAGIGDGRLALAVAEQESLSGTVQNSRAGARGIMQLMPTTAAAYNVKDVCDPHENSRGGIAFLKDLMQKFGGNVFLVLAAYNAGETSVYDAGGVPGNKETVRYVAAVANAYYRFDNTLKGGRRAKPANLQQVRQPPINGAAIANPRGETSGQTWIAGSVLYLGDTP